MKADPIIGRRKRGLDGAREVDLLDHRPIGACRRELSLAAAAAAARSVRRRQGKEEGRTILWKGLIVDEQPILSAHYHTDQYPNTKLHHDLPLLSLSFFLGNDMLWILHEHAQADDRAKRDNYRTKSTSSSVHEWGSPRPRRTPTAPRKLTFPSVQMTDSFSNRPDPVTFSPTDLPLQQASPLYSP